MQKSREQKQQSREEPKREERRREQTRSPRARALTAALSRTALEGRLGIPGVPDGERAALLGNAVVCGLLDAEGESLPQEMAQRAEPMDVPEMDVPDEELPEMEDEP